MKGETMVSDQEIAKGVETLLRQSNPNSVNSVNGVVQQLGAKLGLDLSHKAAFIRDQINLLRHYPPQPPPPQPLASKDHFALHNHLQFHPSPLSLHYPYPELHLQPQQQQQQQQQQHHHHQQQFHPHFALNFPGLIPSPFPSQQPQPQPHQHTPLPQLQPQHPPQPQPQSTARPQQLPAKNAAAPTSEKTPKESAQGGTKRKGGAGGLNKVCSLSPELQVVVGESSLSRTEVVRQLWAYIRKHNLQDPGNKRKIICDDALRAVFETDCTDMFKMNKLLSKHIIPLNPKNESAPAKKAKADDENTSENAESRPSTITISDALAMFLGTTRREMLQSEVVSGVQEYIKANQLEDPNSMMVICDEKLKELFGCENVPVAGLNEMLARDHLFKSS